MYKILQADKDTYVTNRVIGTTVSSSVKTSSNVGAAATIDLFKLYGTSYDEQQNPRVELSRGFIHFDLEPLRDLVAKSNINISHSSFNCRLQLFDVYGGQTTPREFYVSAFPLSRSFAEGEGRDVVYYSDYDACNFLTSSFSDGSWFATGCSFAGYAESACDYITSSLVLGGTSLESKQYFSSGEEDLNIDITTIVSATLAGILPDRGFRLSLSSSQEEDRYSYFVKRFASRSAYNESKRPRLLVRYDDSIHDDSQALRFDSPATIFLRNYENDQLSNIVSGSNLTPIVGSNCLILNLTTIRSDGSGSYSLYVTGSQHFDGANYHTGIYSASFVLPTADTILHRELSISGSVSFTPIWSSLDGTIGYFTGSLLSVSAPNRTTSLVSPNEFVVTAMGLSSLHRTDEEVIVRLNIFSYAAPYIKSVKRPVELPCIVVKRAFYQIRDHATNEVIIPFDEVYNSTRVSSDTAGMYFYIDMSSLPENRSYVIDALIYSGGIKRIYKSVSGIFTVSNTQVT